MMDIFTFIGALVVLFVAGALAYGAIRAVLRHLRAESGGIGLFYFPLAVLLTVVTFRAAMFCLDLVNIYFVSNLIGFD